MRQHSLLVLAGAFAALAFAASPAAAQDISIGGIDVSLGGSGGPGADASADFGGGTPDATASVDAGELGGGAGPTTANVTLGGGTTGVGPATASASLGGTTTGSPFGDATVTLGGGTTGLGTTTGTVSLGGVTSGSPTAGVGIGTAPATGTTTAPGAPGSGTTGIGALASLTPSQLESGLIALAPADLAKFKLTCAQILASPGDHTTEEIAVCQVVAAL